MTNLVVDFDEALRQTQAKPRHLLLGNGFSIGLHRGFSYGSLLGEAGGIDPKLAGIIAERGDGDFEKAMRSLLTDIWRLRDRHAESDLIAALEADMAAMKLLLIRAVRSVHPEASDWVGSDQYAACARFLSEFLGPQRGAPIVGRIFTTNYDLLLYWTVVRHKELKGTDGFGYRNEPWSPKFIGDHRLFFLHGGLHIFKFGDDTRKLIYREGARLIDQIGDRLANNEFPIFVAEGTRDLKLRSIYEHAYLSQALKTFKKVCSQPTNALFTLGHGLGVQDSHITDVIGTGKIGSVFIGAFGGINSDAGMNARAVAEGWLAERASQGGANPLEVRIFDSSQCEVWGPPKA